MISLNYADYLKLDQLLSLQQVRVPTALSRRVSASENFFIVAHQSCELWLSQVLLDLDIATAELSAPEGQLELVLEHLQRVVAIMRVLEEQLAVLNVLPVACFSVFRPYLETASGAQSPHFRELDRRLGVGRGHSRLGEVFVEAVRAAGLDLVELCRRDLRAGVMHRIAATLMDIGHAYWKWKVSHLALVARMIGAESGTGGSSGFCHLLRRVSMPFPELREAQQRAHFTPTTATIHSERSAGNGFMRPGSPNHR